MTQNNLFHEPVLKKEILALLLFKEVETVFDGTLGLGGHAEVILQEFPQVTTYIACDLDTEHLEFAKKRLGEWKDKTYFYHQNFAQLKDLLNEQTKRPLVILLDLGLCSHHVDDSTKGFSFSEDGPLSMAFDSKRKGACADILNKASEEELIMILQEYGEEPHTRKIVSKILEYREEKEFKTTFDLRSVVEAGSHPKDTKKSLMRVFQAFRIAVNDELNVLQKTVESALEIMKSGDRLGIISYHSLEDRIVKKLFILNSKPETVETEKSLHTEVAPARFQLLNRKPIVPTKEEIINNPRSRSAKFRILEKI